MSFGPSYEIIHMGNAKNEKREKYFLCDLRAHNITEMCNEVIPKNDCSLVLDISLNPLENNFYDKIN